MKRAAFDLGRVIMEVNFIEFESKWKEFHLEELEDCLKFINKIQSKQDVGLTTIGESIREKFKLSNYEVEELVECWNNSIRANDEMYNFVELLKSRGYGIAILSNIGKEHIDVIKERYPELFKGVKLHLSSEVGVRKPMKLYFQSFLMDHPEFSGAAYFDDLSENIEMGSRYGLRGYEFNLEKYNKQSEVVRKAERDCIESLIEGEEVLSIERGIGRIIKSIV